MEAPFSLRLLAPLVSRPSADYQARLECARRSTAGSYPEAARHLGLFRDRLKDLAPDELEELYRETFTLSDQAELAEAAGVFLRAPDGREAMTALPVFERLLPSLAAVRNPFTLLFKALCCLLIGESVGALPVAASVHQSSEPE